MQRGLIFRDNSHRAHFEALMLQGEGELSGYQEAFVYIVAMYQEDYEAYEGLPFWLEVYEEVSIDGPVYLLEDCVRLDQYPHERALVYAKQLLRGETIHEEQVEPELLPWVRIAAKIGQVEG